MNFEFYIPTKVFFGEGTIEKLGKIIETYRAEKIFLVTGKSSFEKGEFYGKIMQLIGRTPFSRFIVEMENPDYTIVENGLNEIKKEKHDLIVAIGGGSVIDAAKAIGILANNGGSIVEYFEGKRKITNKGLKFIAIPTTAGTGSEVTQYSVITVGNGKLTLAHDFMFPDYAVIDPLLTWSMPKKLTASTGMDALSHVFESFWSKHHIEAADLYNIKAMKLIFENLRNACDGSREARKKMSLAAFYAGIAIAQTRTAASHAVSYPLTLRFGLPHGAACGITLPVFYLFNKEAMGKERTAMIRDAVGVKTDEEVAETIEKLLKNIGLPTRLHEVGVREEDIPIIVKESMTAGRMKNNPIEMSEEKLKKLLKGIL